MAIRFDRLGSRVGRPFAQAAGPLCAFAIVASLLLPRSGLAAAATDLVIRAVATSFRVGTNGAYSVSVTNGGDADTDAPVHMTVTLPDGLSFAFGGGNGWACSASGPSVDCSISSIPAATTIAFKLVVSVSSTAPAAVTNSLALSYPGDTNFRNNTVTKTTIVRGGQGTQTGGTTPPASTGTPLPTQTRTPTPNPASTTTPTPLITDLLLTKTSVGTFTIGSTAAYFLVVTNLGEEDTNVPMTVVDTLPDGLGFVSAEGDGWTCVAEGQTITCRNPAPLTVGSSTGITLTVNVGEDAYPAVTNFATVSYPGDTATSNNTARKPTTVRRSRGGPSVSTATPVPAGATPTATRTGTPTSIPSVTATPGNAAPTDVLLTKTSAGSFRVGRPGVYTLTVMNVGSQNTNVPVTVIDTLPASLHFVSAVGPGWTCSASGQTMACVHPSPITAGAGAAISLSVNVGRAAFPTVTNSATVSYAGDTDLSNNLAKRPTTVRQ